MKLVELLHLCLISGRSGTVAFESTRGKGLIYLKEGQIKHAEFTNLTGEEAIYSMLESGAGEADYSSTSSPPRVSVLKPSAHILLEAARRVDEKSKTTRISLPGVPTTTPPEFKSLPLLIYYIRDEQKSAALKPKSTHLGRLAYNDIQLDHESVSSRHCCFEIDEQGQIQLSDLGSVNGTYVNGKLIQTPVKVMDGDTIHVGPIPMRLVLEKKTDKI